MKNIQLFKPKFRNKEITELMNECFDKGWTGLGFKTQELEESWKKYTGLKNAHFLNSNTSGLHLALKILKDANKWNDGDEIITSPLTFVSSNHAIMYENLKPVFADVDEYLCLDAKSVEDRITKKTKAIIAVHLYGQACDMDPILDISKKYGIPVIEDCAQAAGAEYKGNKVGSMGVAGCFSFFPTKRA